MSFFSLKLSFSIQHETLLLVAILNGHAAADDKEVESFHSDGRKAFTG
jgi:hypothetical protein